jgi:ABC-type dipeptide/oligopeptide/nickel transport system permease component
MMISDICLAIADPRIRYGADTAAKAAS